MWEAGGTGKPDGRGPASVLSPRAVGTAAPVSSPSPHLPLAGISVPTGDFHSSTHTGSRAGPWGALGTGRDSKREAGPTRRVRSDGQGAGMGTAHDTPHFSQGLRSTHEQTQPILKITHEERRGSAAHFHLSAPPAEAARGDLAAGRPGREPEAPNHICLLSEGGAWASPGSPHPLLSQSSLF